MCILSFITFFASLYLSLSPSFLAVFTITTKAQRDVHKIVIQLIGPDSFVLLLYMDYAEKYSHIQQIMSQQKWFKRLEVSGR